jgi:pyruvate carboxylase subunit B
VKYVVSVAGKRFEVLLDGAEVVVNGRTVSAELIEVSKTPLKELVMDGRSRTYAMTTEQGGWSVIAGGEAQSLRVDDERAVRLGMLEKRGERGGAGGKVKAPMPGLVLRVEVEVGQKVASGTGLVVLEAMKMENEIKSPVVGTVSAVHVNGGQAVEKGMVLVEVLPEA